MKMFPLDVSWSVLRFFFFSSTCRFGQYGLWDGYSELYPDGDLVYTIGVSDYTKDWFYAQAPRSDFCIIDCLYNLAKDYHASLL